MRARLLTITALATLAVACSPEPDPARGDGAGAPPSRPHVVVYLVDTLRRDRLGLYGYEKPTSPFLDQLAEDCTVFEQCFAPGPWTLPSVASMMTSVYPLDHRCHRPGDRVPSHFVPLAERMQEVGYRTFGYVTNTFGGVGSGLDRGYDQLHHPEDHSHDLDLERIEGWLDSAGDDPVFLYLHTLEPHLPFRAPAEFVSRFGEVSEAEDKEIHELFDQLRGFGRRPDPAAQRGVVQRLQELQTPSATSTTVAWRGPTTAWRRRSRC